MIFKPHNYQQRAIEWILTHPRCGLFLEMGLGKSVVTLTAIRTLMKRGEVHTTLVVAPKKVAESTWSAECEKWDHLADVRVSRVMGAPDERAAALLTAADIYVIGRDNFVWLCGYYGGRLPFDALVIDELTSFKSHSSQRFKAMRQVTGKFAHVIGLTGTPSPNGLPDLWAQLYCLDEGQRLGRYITHYRDRFFNQIKRNNIIVKMIPKPGAEEEIRAAISDICLSMQATDYLELPGLHIIDEKVALPSSIMKRYSKFAKDQVADFQATSADAPRQVVAQSAASLLNKLSQWANGAIYDEEGNSVFVHNEKIDRLTEIVDAANGESVLVFYQFRHDVPRIIEALKGYKVRTYEGDDTLRAWNAGRIDVLLAHPASTAYGLNMQQGGHYIVWFGTGWDLELYQQANARLYRQGQKKPVFVYRLIASGTVDERAAATLDEKRTRQQGLMDGLKQLLKKYTNGKEQRVPTLDQLDAVVAAETPSTDGTPCLPGL